VKPGAAVAGDDHCRHVQIDVARHVCGNKFFQQCEVAGRARKGRRKTRIIPTYRMIDLMPRRITSDSSSSPDARDQLVHLRLSRTCRIFSGRTWKGGPGGTPTAIGIGGINSSASVQVAPVVILAARLGVGRADVPGHRDHSNRQRGQESEDSKAHDCLSMCRGPLARSSAIGRDSANRVVPPRYVVAGMGRFIRTSSWDTLPRSSPKPRRARPLPSASCARDRLGMRPRRTPKLPGLS
jgi:hypothetical protein